MRKWVPLLHPIGIGIGCPSHGGNREDFCFIMAPLLHTSQQRKKIHLWFFLRPCMSKFFIHLLPDLGCSSSDWLQTFFVAFHVGINDKS